MRFLLYMHTTQYVGQGVAHIFKVLPLLTPHPRLKQLLCFYGLVGLLREDQAEKHLTKNSTIQDQVLCVFYLNASLAIAMHSPRWFCACLSSLSSRQHLISSTVSLMKSKSRSGFCMTEALSLLVRFGQSWATFPSGT